MPRQARKKSIFSVYHIIQRGNEKKNIFLDDQDRRVYLKTLARFKEKLNFEVYSYCLMDNHTHLLIYDNGNDISDIIKKINISYAFYFNKRYARCGHLFQDRFKSQLVTEDDYLLQVSKYIHNNPVKAGLVKHSADYWWSSYHIYRAAGIDQFDLIDKDRILEVISSDKNSAVKEYIKFSQQVDDHNYTMLDVEEDVSEKTQDNISIGNTIIDGEQMLRELVANNNTTLEQLQFNKNLRNSVMREIYKECGLSLGELGRMFGNLSKSRVCRILKNGQ